MNSSHEVTTGSMSSRDEVTTGGTSPCDEGTTSATDFAEVTDDTLASLRAQLKDCLDDLQSAAQLRHGQVLVIGASSSEIIGKRIGTHTSLGIGKVVVAEVLSFQRRTGCDVAFQCCEHLNRALVVQRSAAVRHGWQEVTAIPVPGAGGAVAAHAFHAMQDACLVESIEADAGLDVGDTLIGMHLRRVAVPVRGRRTNVLSAHVIMARTRPPLIGGVRAVYDAEEGRRRLFGDATSPTGEGVHTHDQSGELGR